MKSLGVQSLALLAVAVLLLTSLGPMVDHHFAERHPAHGHLFPGAAGGEHTHPFEHSHIHYDAMYAPATGDAKVIFFAPSDGAHARADVVAPTLMPQLGFGGDGGPLLISGVYSASLLRGVYVSPLAPPPRA